jgi:hypothetical protein
MMNDELYWGERERDTITFIGSDANRGEFGGEDT